MHYAYALVLVFDRFCIFRLVCILPCKRIQTPSTTHTHTHTTNGQQKSEKPLSGNISIYGFSREIERKGHIGHVIDGAKPIRIQAHKRLKIYAQFFTTQNHIDFNLVWMILFCAFALLQHFIISGIIGYYYLMSP